MTEIKTRAEIGEERRARMRARLLAAGARVLARADESTATIDDFIHEAKVARGTFYNYFPCREALLHTLRDAAGKDPLFEIKRVCDLLENPAVRLGSFIRYILSFTRQSPTWGWLVLSLCGDRAIATSQLRSHSISYLEAGREAGIFRFDDVNCAGDLVMGAVRSGIGMLLDAPRQDQYPQLLCKMVLLALGLDNREAERFSHATLPPLPVNCPLQKSSSADDTYVARNAELTLGGNEAPESRHLGRGQTSHDQR